MAVCRHTPAVLKLLVSALLALSTVSAAEPASESSAKEPGITTSQADAILNELRQIRQLLENQAKENQVKDNQPRPATPPAVPQKRSVKVQGGYTLGSDSAPLTMIEYTDYQCPFCRSFETGVFDQIRKAYIDTGKLRFISRNLPLDMHPDAQRAAESALCAGDQGQYWPMRDFLFQSKDLNEKPILDFAQSVKLDTVAFRACIDGEKHRTEILADIGDAKALQIGGTPAFVIGKTPSFGVEGYVTAGVMPFAQFDARFKALE